MDKKIVYMDYAATTPLDSQVLRAMEPYFTENFYNPSSLYSPARACAEAVDEARKTAAGWIHAGKEEEIIFTGGGSESDNLAVYGISMANRDRGNHIITTSIEHHAVLHAAEGMKEHGFDVTFLPVDEYGLVDLDILTKSIRRDTILISVMFANNEIGTVEPIKKIGEVARERGIFFHTDAVQAAGTLPIDVQDMNIDAMSMSAHKFYGPKGVGMLYLRDGVRVFPHIKGGMQEQGRRAGTHNTPGIVGAATALDLAYKNMEENNRRISALRDRLVKGIVENIPHVIYNGHPDLRLPNNANFCFKFVESEAILLHLDMLGVCASSGSACTTGSEAPSHVLEAIGITPDIARSSMRFSLGKYNTEEEVDFVVETMKKVVGNLRKMSPLAS